MQTINLDRSINLTREIMNGNYELPKNLHVNKVLGGMVSFNFDKCGKVLPIEHIGLAVMAYNGARSSYTTLRCVEDGQTEETFEPLQEGLGYHLSDFLSNADPDSLNWYRNTSGEQIRMDYVEGKVLRQITTKYTQCKISNPVTGEDYREAAIREGVKSSMREYLGNVFAEAEDPESESFKAEVVDFVNNETAVLDASLANLREQSLLKLPATEIVDACQN